MESHSSWPPSVLETVDSGNGVEITEAELSSRFEELSFVLQSDISFEDPYTLRLLSLFVKLLLQPSGSQLVDQVNLRQRFVAELIALMKVSFIGLRSRYALFKAIDSLDPYVECSVPIGSPASFAIDSMNSILESVEKYIDYLKNLDDVFSLPHPHDYYRARALAFSVILKRKSDVLSKARSFPLVSPTYSSSEKKNLLHSAFLDKLIYQRDVKVLHRHSDNVLYCVSKLFGEHSLEPPEEMN